MLLYFSLRRAWPKRRLCATRKVALWEPRRPIVTARLRIAMRRDGFRGQLRLTTTAEPHIEMRKAAFRVRLQPTVMERPRTEIQWGGFREVQRQIRMGIRLSAIQWAVCRALPRPTAPASEPPTAMPKAVCNTVEPHDELRLFMPLSGHEKRTGTIAADLSGNSRGPLFLFALAKRKRAGGVLLSRGRVPHYPRRWGA